MYALKLVVKQIILAYVNRHETVNIVQYYRLNLPILVFIVLLNGYSYNKLDKEILPALTLNHNNIRNEANSRPIAACCLTTDCKKIDTTQEIFFLDHNQYCKKLHHTNIRRDILQKQIRSM